MSQQDRRRPTENQGTDGSSVTVVLAGLANLVIALAKLAAGLISSSSAMLAESAHSFADTLNQGFLIAALKRSRRPADAQHPFGYGMERYLWSLLAAVGIFVLGAGFSVFEGVSTLVRKPSAGSPVVSYAVLAFSALFEGVSLLRGLWQVRRRARENRHGISRELQAGADPTAKTVVFEDTAALAGIMLAAAGLTLHELTGSAVWDASASICIGLLLIGVAVTLGRQSQQFLIGRALEPDQLKAIRAELEDVEGVSKVVELLTMRLGPDDVLLAAKVSVGPDTRGEELSRAADEADERIRAEHPEVRHVFLDPTPEAVYAETAEPAANQPR